MTTATATPARLTGTEVIRGDITKHTWANKLIEVWQRPTPRGSARRSPYQAAVIEMYMSDGGKTFVVRDGRPYGHVDGDARNHLSDNVHSARADYRRVSNTLKAEGYTKVKLVALD